MTWVTQKGYPGGQGHPLASHRVKAGTTQVSLPWPCLPWKPGQPSPPELSAGQTQDHLPSGISMPGSRGLNPPRERARQPTPCGHLSKAEPNTSHLLTWVWGGGGARISSDRAASLTTESSISARRVRCFRPKRIIFFHV